MAMSITARTLVRRSLLMIANKTIKVVCGVQMEKIDPSYGLIGYC